MFRAVPVLLGKNGVEKVLSYGNLTAFEAATLDEALDQLNGDIALGEAFIES